MVRSPIHFCLSIGVLTVVLLAGRGASQTPVHPGLMTPAPVVFSVAGGVTVTLSEVDLHIRHFQYDICGPDVTQIPAAFRLAFSTDAPIRHVVVRPLLVRLAFNVQVSEHAATLTLTRDPFVPPQPWRLTLLVDFERLPTSGRIAVAPAEAHDVTFHIWSSLESRAVLQGTGCGELLAGPAFSGHDYTA